MDEERLIEEVIHVSRLCPMTPEEMARRIIALVRKYDKAKPEGELGVSVDLILSNGNNPEMWIVRDMQRIAEMTPGERADILRLIAMVPAGGELAEDVALRICMAEIGKLEAQLDTQRSYIDTLRADVAAERQRAENAETELYDWKNSYTNALHPHNDEVHCSCVPHLHRRIAELEAELAGHLDDSQNEVCHLGGKIRRQEAQLATARREIERLSAERKRAEEALKLQADEFRKALDELTTLREAYEPD